MGEYFDSYAGGEPSADAAPSIASDYPESSYSDADPTNQSYAPNEDAPPPPNEVFAGGTDIASDPTDSLAWISHAGGELGPLFSAGKLLPMAKFGIGGPSGVQVDTGSGSGGALTPRPAGRKYAILHAVAAQLGQHVSAKDVVRVIVKYGFGAAAALYKIGAQDLLYLFFEQKGKSHHRRGPHLYTIAKHHRRDMQYQAMVSRILGRGGGHHHRRRARPFHHRRRRRK